MDKAAQDHPRPSPDALLRATHRARAGRLKIFLGAAPGVGKTYAMLLAARARAAEGVDVVVAVVETHGRAETQALLAGLDVLGRRPVAYRGHTLDEMDLDAVLARRPQLALVDELAHSNAEGSRHPKRYNDVEELLDAGIDVFTTLNVQHVESLNTVVAQITRIRVRETVPDRILDRADDIEAIDIAPDDLIGRLREGKVYLPKQAERAIANFFSPGNLTALRELTLRRTAQRVDAQLLAHMQLNAIPGPWAAGERVLVCVGAGVDSAGLIRLAKRVADRLHAAAAAIHVETARAGDEARRDGVAEAMRFAGRLGLEAVTVPGAGRRVADDVLAYAHANNVTQIIVGKARRSRWFEALNGSVTFDLVRHAGDISVHVIAVPEADASARSGRASSSAAVRLSPYAGATALVAGALGVAEILQPLLGLQNIDLVFLTAVVGAAITWGLTASLFAVLLSTLCYNFFFLPPLYTFTVADPGNVAALFFFTLVAVLVSNLTARVRAQATVAAARARTTEALYAFSRKLASCVGVEDVLWATCYQIASMLKVNVVTLLPDENGTLHVRAGYPPEDELAEADLAAAQWTWTRSTPAGRGAETLPGARRYFAPMRTGRGGIGVVGLDGDRPGELLSPEQHRLFSALLDQSALAVERVNLVGDLDRARRVAETDRLRSALLTSISHDLRTPLASILGSATTIRDFGADLDEEGRAGLIGTVVEEAERLNRFIANLLDMTRLEAGAVKPNLQPVDAGEIVGAALARAKAILVGRRVVADVAPDLPLLMLDPVLFEQALFNLLDNAAKYGDPGTAVTVRLRRDGQDGGGGGAGLRVEVMDEGPGIPAADVEAVFAKFHRVQRGDAVRPGTGLGLAISRGFVEAMGGTLDAGNRTDRSGAVLTLRLPLPADALNQAA